MDTQELPMIRLGIRKVLELHKKWLNDEEGGEKVNLSGANLREVNLSRTDLSEAILSGADLSEAILIKADLSGADLRGADLREADLRGANLRGADLIKADLREAILRGANLSGANLSGADLREADLRGADLRGADLRGADLRRADLRGAKTMVIHLGQYIAYVQPDSTRIGCQYHTNDEWRKFPDELISRMASDALEWWTENKELIFCAMDSFEVKKDN